MGGCSSSHCVIFTEYMGGCEGGHLFDSANRVENRTMMASTIMATMLPSSTTNKNPRLYRNYISTSRKHRPVRAMMIEKPLEELYNVKVERKVSKDRLVELGVSRWSVWKTGKCKLPWDWQTDQLVYIEEGEVRVVPEGSERYMSFVAGDLVRYPKWFEADLWFNDFYQERYSFRAYGDD